MEKVLSQKTRMSVPRCAGVVKRDPGLPNPKSMSRAKVNTSDTLDRKQSSNLINSISMCLCAG